MENLSIKKKRKIMNNLNFFCVFFRKTVHGLNAGLLVFVSKMIEHSHLTNGTLL